MKTRTSLVGVAVLLGLTLAGCGGETSSNSPAPPASQSQTQGQPPASDSGTGSDSSGLDGITFPPGAVVTPLGTNQKQYAVTGMSLDDVKAFFESQMLGAGYVRAQEASASRFYDKGTKRIQVTWADMQGTIRGVVRVTRN
jgi:hypothetical protein